MLLRVRFPFRRGRRSVCGGTKRGPAQHRRRPFRQPDQNPFGSAYFPERDWPDRGSGGLEKAMLKRGESRVLSAVLALVLLAATTYGQAPAVPPGSVESEVAGIKAENAALREQLRRVEEQQKTLLEIVNQLQQRFGPITTTMAAEAPPVPKQDPPAATQVLEQSSSSKAPLPTPDQNK